MTSPDGHTSNGHATFFQKRWSRDIGRSLVLSNIWKEKRLFVLTILFSALGAAFEGIGIGLLVPFLENLTDPAATPWQTGWSWFDTYLLAIHASVTSRLYHISGLILLTVWLRALLGYLSAYVGVKMSESVLRRMRGQAADQLLAVSLRFFSKTRTGEVINTLTTEVQRARSLFSIATESLIKVFLLLAYLSAIVWLSWQLSLVTLGLCIGLFLVVNPILRSLLARGKDISRVNGRITSVISELVNGIRTITVFGTKPYERARFERANEESARAIVAANRQSARVGPLSQSIASTALIVMLIVAVQFFVLEGAMTAASLLVFLFALLRLLPIVQQLNSARAQWGVVRGSLDTVTNLLRTDDKPYLDEGSRPLPAFTDQIELQHVDFSYEPGQRVIDDVSLTIRHGQTTAFVGASGAGKSTLVDLIARLYDPDAGRILLDGHDLHEYQLDDLRQQMAVVSQDTFLFNDTVRENIAYGLEDVSEARIREVAEEANALGFIEEMEDGFDTMMGERGVRLSGGQRQRIAIARALLRDPELLILDEATSALDSVSEKLVQSSLEHLMQGRTVIVIAHRLSTVENADQVVVLEEGRVVEKGAYEELLEQKGQLWKYHEIQFQLA